LIRTRFDLKTGPTIGPGDRMQRAREVCFSVHGDVTLLFIILFQDIENCEAGGIFGPNVASPLTCGVSIYVHSPFMIWGRLLCRVIMPIAIGPNILG